MLWAEKELTACKGDGRLWRKGEGLRARARRKDGSSTVLEMYHENELSGGGRANLPEEEVQQEGQQDHHHAHLHTHTEGDYDLKLDVSTQVTDKMYYLHFDYEQEQFCLKMITINYCKHIFT